MTKRTIRVFGAGGTWDFRQHADWTHPGGRLSKVLEGISPNLLMQQHDDFWSHHEEGLIVERAWNEVLRGLSIGHRDKFPLWAYSGKRMREWLLRELNAEGPAYDVLILAHSHAGQVLAYALSGMNEEDDRWLGREHRNACSRQIVRHPPLRELSVVWVGSPVVRGMRYYYADAYRAMAARQPFSPERYMRQTRSSGLDWRSWPQWLGADRPPWSHAKIDDRIPQICQPGGHSAVLYNPEPYAWWWRKLLGGMGLAG